MHLMIHSGCRWQSFPFRQQLLFMATYQELLAQRNALDQRIKLTRETESKQALAHIKELVSTFGFTAQEVFPWKPDQKKTVAAKYYDPESGASWTGRGKPPKWIDGKDRSKYEIQSSQTELLAA